MAKTKQDPKFLAAKAKLPKWARGILQNETVVDVGSLRKAVRQECRAAEQGDNPLTAKQYDQLVEFLNRTV